MNGLGSVVVGVDGSPAAHRALVWAAARASKRSPVHVVHAVSPAVELAFAAMLQDRTKAMLQVRSVLDGPWSEPARTAGCSTLTHLVEDDPVDSLLSTAKEAEADTIVIGPHGSGTGRVHGLGSVTRRLLGRSTVPVIVVDRIDQVSTSDFVVACVGYGRAAQQAAAWAADYAASRGCRLVLVHVVSYRPVFPFDAASDVLSHYLGGDVPVKWAEADLEEIRQKLTADHPSLDITCHVGRGSASKGIEQVSAGAELVVLGRLHGHQFGSRSNSARTRTVIAGATSPVAIIPVRD